MKNKFIILLISIILIVGAIACCHKFNNKKTKESYEIPKVYFEGNISNMTTKKDERLIRIKYESNTIDFESYAKIKIQGTSSIAYEKKNYTINLYKDKKLVTKNKIDVGFGKQNKYCLKANWIDKTHARNIVTAKLVSEVQNKYNLFVDTPNNGLIDGFPVEVFINGEFLGIYTWNIPKDAWMFNMNEENPNHIVYSGETWSESNYFKTISTNGEWGIEVGRGNKQDLEKLNKLLDFVANSSDEDFKKNFNKHLNFDATINYLILMEFALLYDNSGKNTLLATYDGQIWYPTLYDLDTSWGTKWDGKSIMDYEYIDFIYNSKLWERMIKLYPKEINERYFELRKDILKKEHVLKIFNEFKELIPESSFAKENQRWENIPGYNYTQIEEFLDIRIPLLDKFMNNLI